MLPHRNDLEIYWRLHFYSALENAVERAREKFLFQLEIKCDSAKNCSYAVEIRPFPFENRRLFLASPHWHESKQQGFEIHYIICDEKVIAIVNKEMQKLARHFRLRAKALTPEYARPPRL